MANAALAFVIAAGLGVGSPVGWSQASAPVSDSGPAFEAVTIKPPDPSARSRPVGFYGKPGGRIFFGGNVKMLVEFAYSVRSDEVTGAPDWAASQFFEINAVPPEDLSSRTIQVGNAEPTANQRLMLQSLLRERFGLRVNRETKQGDVYVLSRGSKPLQLKPPADPTEDPRAIVAIRQGGIVNGEAFGMNTTMDYLAVQLSHYLRASVLNQTGIAGSSDFNLPATDPENTDEIAAVFSVVDRLGLKLRRERGPVQTLMIDHVQQPTPN